MSDSFPSEWKQWGFCRFSTKLNNSKSFFFLFMVFSYFDIWYLPWSSLANIQFFNNFHILYMNSNWDMNFIFGNHVVSKQPVSSLFKKKVKIQMKSEKSFIKTINHTWQFGSCSRKWYSKKQTSDSLY